MNKIAKIAVVIGVVAVVGAVVVNGGDDDTEKIVATFRDASPLEPGSEVRASGVLVGEIDSIDLNRKDGVAKVGLNIDKSVLPVYRDAKLVIKPINLLGETYLELDPGSPEKGYLSDNALGVKNTGSAVTLQGLLDTFDDPTSAGLAALVLTSGEALEGNGENTAAAIKALGPAMQDIDRLGDILREQNDVLAALVDQANPVAASLAKNDGRELDRTITALTQTLSATRDKQTALARTIEELPATLEESRRTFSALETVSSQLGPTLRKARPVTRDLDEISDEIATFSKYADPAFRSFDDLFEAADELLKEAAPSVKSLRKNGSKLVDITNTVDYASSELLDDHRRELMTFVRYWALSTNSRDAASHYFRGVVHVSPETLQMLAGFENPPIKVPSLDATGGLRDPIADAGDLADGLTKSLGGRGEAKKSPSRSLTQRNGGATGLTPKQERNLIGSLLGGW